VRVVAKTRQALFLGALFAVFALPLGLLGLYAFSSQWSFPDLLPKRFDLRAFEYIASQSGQVLLSLAGSILYSLLTVLLTLGLCLWPARFLARQEFRLKSLTEGLLLAPALVPAMTFSMGIHFIFIKLGLADTLPGVVLILTVFTYPYMLRALISGFQTFGPEFAVCARNLGAGPLTTALKVELPLLLPSLIAGGSVVFLVAFSEYFLVFLIGGGAIPSFAGYLFPFLNSSDRSTASLLTLIFLAAPLLLFVLIDFTVGRCCRRWGLS
jgi:putative spermidine/putrescine transport system permease protein